MSDENQFDGVTFLKVDVDECGVRLSLPGLTYFKDNLISIRSLITLATIWMVFFKLKVQLTPKIAS